MCLPCPSTSDVFKIILPVCPQPTLQSCLLSAPPPTITTFIFSLDGCIDIPHFLVGKIGEVGVSVLSKLILVENVF